MIFDWLESIKSLKSIIKNVSLIHLNWFTKWWHFSIPLHWVMYFVMYFMMYFVSCDTAMRASFSFIGSSLSRVLSSSCSWSVSMTSSIWHSISSTISSVDLSIFSKRKLKYYYRNRFNVENSNFLNLFFVTIDSKYSDRFDSRFDWFLNQYL